MKKDHMIILMEDLNSKFDFVLENIVPDVKDLKERVSNLQQDMSEVKDDISSTKVWLHDHEQRLVRLETT